MAKKGYKVTVFEANDYPGGKIAELHLNGYRFDMGPSVLTMPEYIDELFTLHGENPRDYFKYQKLDPIFRYFFEDGTTINAYHGKEKLADEMASKTSVSREKVIQFLEKSETKFFLTDEVFLQRSLHKIGNYFNYPTLRGILNFHKIEAFKTMADANFSFFEDKKVAEIFNRYASYNGSNPYEAPATLNIIPHYEINLGAYFPEGGMHTITKSLVELAMKVRVDFKFKTRVKEIQIENGTATGLTTENGNFPFDVIISNSDVFNTYHTLIPKAHKPERILNQPKSSSVIVFYWGIKKTFPGLGLHNMFFSEDSRQEYDHIFKRQTVFSDPTVYLNISSKANPADAPAGCENWFVMITVPNNSGQDWDKLIAETREYAINKLNKILKTGILPLIECESILDPRLIEQKTSSAFGAVYGNSSNSKFAAFLRHPNFSNRILNLYFCGGSVHPGPSIPLCLLSAKITVGLVE